MNSFIGWIGGKRELKKTILDRFPKDHVSRYIEVFGGAGWVFFSREKQPGQLEVFNDADGQLVNLYRCVKYHAQALAEELEWLLSAREVFLDAKAQAEVSGLTDIQRAARFLYLIKFSFGSKCSTFTTSPRSIENCKEQLLAVKKRLQGVAVENLDFERLISIYDRPNALFYCDPPYVGAEHYYSAPFSKADHKRLAACLRSVKGRFVLSYNEHPLVRELYDGAKIETIERPNKLAGNSNSVPYREVLVRNF